MTVAPIGPPLVGYAETAGASSSESVPPLVSVVIPVRNRAHLVGEAIQSVLEQTYRSVEVLVVDDGSCDGTGDFLQAVAAAEPRVTTVSLATPRGAQAAKNRGIMASSGLWVAFLDSDDRYLPDSIALRVRAAEASGALVVRSEGRLVTASGVEPRCGVPPLAGWVYRSLLGAPATLFPSLLVRRDVLELIGYLDEAIVAWQEWETAIRLSRHAVFAYVPIATFDYDQRTSVAISRDASRAARGYEQIVRKHWRAIVRELGPKGLANHFRTMAVLRRDAGDWWGMMRCRMVSGLLWPPNVVRPARRLLLRKGR